MNRLQVTTAAGTAALLTVLLGAPLPAWAEHTSYLSAIEAINKAGRQRMLSQRIVKSYLQTAEGIAADAARAQLAEAITVFDDQLGDLKSFETEPDLLAPYFALETEWLAFRAYVTATPNRESAKALFVVSQRLLEAAERNTAALEQHAGGASARLVNISGRQRMLSQRIAKDYLYLGAHFDDPSIKKELATAREDFGRALAELSSAPQNTDEIRQELAVVATQWKELQPMLARERPTVAERAKLVAMTDAILARMERVTSLYQKP